MVVGSSNKHDAWERVIPKLRVPSVDYTENSRRIWQDGRRLEVDPLTGACAFTVPIPVTVGRAGFEPELNLTYNSSSRNSIYGWGWNLAVSDISRRTKPEIPRYREADDDTYLLADDELVPALRHANSWVDDRFDVGEYVVQRYRRRIEQQHHRVERWQHQPSGQTHWRVVDENNVTSLYGSSDESRVSDPADSAKILRWLLAERFDDRGNIIRYTYKREDLSNVDLEEGIDTHRREMSDAQGGGRYLKRIQYGNAAPHDRTEWHFEVVFDYGEHDQDQPGPYETQPWPARKDAYSSHRAGFETRVWRLCRRILMFHNFGELGDSPTLVSSVNMEHDLSSGHALLTKIQQVGYIVRADGSAQTRTLPPLEFGYQRPDFDDTIHSLDAENVVGALLDSRSGARWIDLNDEALPGLAMRVGGSWCFVRNYGGGSFGEPEVVADELRLEPDEAEVIDLDEAEKSPPTPAHDREYQPLTTIRSTANVNQDDPYVGYLDLNGDLADDVVVADERLIRWYPSQGEDGFGDPIVVKLDTNGSVRPRCLHADERQSLWVADMTGDGLYDIVRVRSGEVSYWPHRGRGRFGNRVVMDGSPTMPAGSAGTGRILLGDLSASGTADLVWIDNGEIRYWENFNGGRFGSPRRASAPGISPGGPGVAAVDIFGRGADCITWIDQTSGVPSLRYISPVGERRPHLMFSVKNGRGGETRAAYVSTAELRKRDREAGLDQLTSLPLPLQVVQRIEHRDNVGNTRDLTRYVFRHGAYDEHARAFLGFAYQEEWRSGTQEEYEQPGLFAHEPAIAVEGNRRAIPTLTKYWRHTGVMFEGEDLTNELTMEYFADPFSHKRSWLQGNQMPEDDRAGDAQDAHAALRGFIIREEFYDVANGTAAVPLVVQECIATVRQVQPSRGGRAGSHDARTLERVKVYYDSEGNDPRVDHELFMEIDAFGTPLRVAQIAYGRRRPMDSAQGVVHVLLTENSVYNYGDNSTWHRVRVPNETVIWELLGISGSIGDLYEAAEIAQQFVDMPAVTPGGIGTGSYRRVVSRERSRYWSNDLSRMVTADKLESRALLARQDRLSLSDAMVRHLYDERDVVDTLRYEGGYEHEDGLWWAPGLTVNYSAANFYVPVSWRDALGRLTSVRYDSSGLAIEQIEDPLGNIERFVTSKRTMKPWQHIDVNNNVVALRFDPIGNVLSTAVMGKPGAKQGDVLPLDILEASSRDDPTVVVTYATHNAETGDPALVRVRHRARHRDDKANLFDQISYFDSEGRSLAVSRRSDAGAWLVSEFCRRDSAGAVVAVAEPFLSETAWPQKAEVDEALRLGYSYRRDAMGRVTRTDNPGGTYETVEYSPWAQVHADANDNIMDGSWFADRHGSVQGRAADFAARAMQQYEARAAALAAVHANTPTTYLLDGNGRQVVVNEALSTQETIIRKIIRNFDGSISAHVDTRGLQVERFSTDLMGRMVRTDHADAGIHAFLLAATGEVLRTWDPTDRCTRFRYDALGRPTHSYFDPGVGPEMLIERTIWGGGEVSIPDAQERNLVGVPHIKLTSAGLEVADRCDWNGNTTRHSLQTATSYDQTPNWRVVDEVAHVGQLQAALNNVEVPLLNQMSWVTETEFDAISRPLQRNSVDVGVTRFTYGAYGRLERITLQLDSDQETTILDEVRYDSMGRPSLLKLGNGSWARRHYNASGRLAHLGAAVRGGEETLQDLSVVYDPNGNVMSVSDGTELVASFAYDGADRLIKAEGREAMPAFKQSETPAGRPSRRAYADTFTLDSEGNVSSWHHKSGADETTTSYQYQSGGNQLRAAFQGDQSREPFAPTYQYDDSGNVIHTPNQHSYRWDANGLLTMASGEDGTRAFFGYLHGGLLARKVIERNGGEVEEVVTYGQFERRRRMRGDVAVMELHSVVIEVDGLPVAVAERTVLGPDQQSAVRFQLTDHLNSAVLEVANDGSVVGSRTFSAFGISASLLPEFSSHNMRFGFRGLLIDEELSLYQAGGRWYDPETGRFIQPSRQLSEHTNTYLFNNGNPQRP